MGAIVFLGVLALLLGSGGREALEEIGAGLLQLAGAGAALMLAFLVCSYFRH